MAYNYAAGTPVSTLGRPASPPRAPHILFWRVEGGKPGWIFGTIHSSDPQLAEIPAAVATALKQCRTFHPEIELSAATEAALAAKLLLAGSSDLQTVLPVPLWRRTVAAGEAVGLPEFFLHQLTPGMAALLFAAPPETDPLATLDGRLYTSAQEAGLSISPLETIDEQLDIFLGLPTASAIGLLKESLAEREAGYPGIANIKKAYLSGDEKKISAELLGEFQKSPPSAALAEPLLYHRNQVMAARAAPSLRRGGAFIAVGAGHLLGPKGLIELLRRQGFRVTPAS